jgi:hypothetical protein
VSQPLGPITVSSLRHHFEVFKFGVFKINPTKLRQIPSK